MREQLDSTFLGRTKWRPGVDGETGLENLALGHLASRRVHRGLANTCQPNTQVKLLDRPCAAPQEWRNAFLFCDLL